MCLCLLLNTVSIIAAADQLFFDFNAFKKIFFDFLYQDFGCVQAREPLSLIESYVEDRISAKEQIYSSPSFL